MKNLVAVCVLSLACLQAAAQDSGMITRPSKHSVAETSAKLQAAIESSGVYKIFYQLDHAMNAEKEASAKQLEDGDSHRRYRGLSGVF